MHHPPQGFHLTKGLRLLGAESLTVRSNGTLVHGIVHSTEKRGELLSVHILRLRQLKLHCSFNAPLDVQDHVPITLFGLLSASMTEILIGDAWRHLQQSVHLPKFGKFTACSLEVRDAQVLSCYSCLETESDNTVFIRPNCRSFTTPAFTSLMLRSERYCSNASTSSVLLPPWHR